MSYILFCSVCVVMPSLLGAVCPVLVQSIVFRDPNADDDEGP